MENPSGIASIMIQTSMYQPAKVDHPEEPLLGLITSDNLEDLVYQYLRQVPFSLVIRQVHRQVAFSNLIHQLSLRPNNILDAGCGDGSWWQILGAKNVDIYGIDHSEAELSLARQRFTACAKLDVSQAGFRGRLEDQNWPVPFELVIGNCSLEHVFDINGALSNISEVMKSGAYFLVFVPTPTWALQGRMLGFLSRRFPRLAMTVSGGMNGFFQHWHLWSHETWSRLLQSHGFEVSNVIRLGGSRSEFCFRLGLPFALVSFLFKTIFRRYPSFLVPDFLLRRLSRFISQYLGHEFFSNGEDRINEHNAYEYIFLCRKN